jgi:hypothetical protein
MNAEELHMLMQLRTEKPQIRKRNVDGATNYHQLEWAPVAEEEVAMRSGDA